jgi:hypothetical protein
MASQNARDPERRETHLLEQRRQLSTRQGSLAYRAPATDVIAALLGRPVDFPAAERLIEGRAAWRAGSAHAKLRAFPAAVAW